MARKILKRATALAMASAVLLGGCGSQQEADKIGGGNATETAAGGSANAPKGNGPGYDYIAGLPKLSEEKVSFTLAVTQEVGQKDWNDMEFFKALEAATNVHIDFECYPVASYNDQKNLMLASGEYPDGFLGYLTLSMADLNQYGPMGIFIPVEDLMEEYSPNYLKRLEERPVLDGLSTAFDGHKYSWGTVNESPSRDFPDNLYINKAWLDNLGLSMPTTMDEYYEVLKAFKDQDANGNGDPNDEIPYTFLAFHHTNGYGGFFGAYGRAEAFNNASGTVGDHFVVEDGKLVYQPITEEYKTAIKELRRFFKDGLFDAEGFVQDGEQYNAKITSATPIVGSAYMWGIAAMSEENRAQYVALKPLKATADSDEAAVHKRQNHVGIQPTGLAITEKCKNPEILAQWMDLCYTDERTILGYYGPDKVTGIDENGVFTFDESVSADGAGFFQQVLENAPYDGSPKFLTFDLTTEKVHLEDDSSLKLDMIEQYYLNAPASVTLPLINYTNEENEFLSNYGMSIQSYVMQTQSQWLMGEKDIDKDWDAYVKQLEGLKLQEFLDTMQGAYDRTVGK